MAEVFEKGGPDCRPQVGPIAKLGSVQNHWHQQEARICWVPGCMETYKHTAVRV